MHTLLTLLQIRETFSFAHPCEQIAAMDKYCNSLYGSNLWNLNDEGTKKIFAAWKTSIKLAWKVHRGCRSFLLENVLAKNIRSCRVNLMSRFHGFFLRLLDSPSLEASVVARLSARDMRTNIGSNLALICHESGLDPWMSSQSSMKEALTRAERTVVPARDAWRIPYLAKLLESRLQAYYLGNEEEDIRLTSLINSLVIN